MQQTENIIRSKTPTGPELDSSYRGYVSTLTSVIQTSTWKSQLCDKEHIVWGTRAFGALSKHHAALELTGMNVQNKFLGTRYLLSQPGPCSGPRTYWNDQAVPLNRELSEINLMDGNRRL